MFRSFDSGPRGEQEVHFDHLTDASSRKQWIWWLHYSFTRSKAEKSFKDRELPSAFATVERFDASGPCKE